MTAATGAAFAVAAVFAIGDWVSRARDNRRLEYVCKPATLAMLVVAAVLADPAAGAGAQRAWFVAALAWSLLGDVLLMLPRERFVAGLVAFLVGHVAYVAGFWTNPPSATAVAVSAVAVACVLGPVAARLFVAVRAGRHRSLAGPVGAYVLVISAMVVSALASGNALAGGGAVLFAASDSTIAWNRFVAPLRWAPVGIMVTYHLGQAGLVASLLYG